MGEWKEIDLRWVSPGRGSGTGVNSRGLYRSRFIDNQCGKRISES